jgi:hypothetical protein
VFVVSLSSLAPSPSPAFSTPTQCLAVVSEAMASRKCSTVFSCVLPSFLPSFPSSTDTSTAAGHRARFQPRDRDTEADEAALRGRTGCGRSVGRRFVDFSLFSLLVRRRATEAGEMSMGSGTRLSTSDDETSTERFQGPALSGPYTLLAASGKPLSACHTRTRWRSKASSDANEQRRWTLRSSRWGE